MPNGAGATLLPVTWHPTVIPNEAGRLFPPPSLPVKGSPCAERNLSSISTAQQNRSTRTLNPFRKTRHSERNRATLLPVTCFGMNESTQEPTRKPDTRGTQHPKVVVSYLSSIRSTSVILPACVEQEEHSHLWATRQVDDRSNFA
jgi:hypothetical protein